MQGRGLRDWIIQRFSAIYLALFTFFMVAFIVKQPSVEFEQWKQLFSNPCMKIATLLALVMTALHAWVGIWTVLTDYVKPIAVRYLLQALIIIGLFACVVWGVFIVWSV